MEVDAEEDARTGTGLVPINDDEDGLLTSSLASLVIAASGGADMIMVAMFEVVAALAKVVAVMLRCCTPGFSRLRLSARSALTIRCSASPTACFHSSPASMRARPRRCVRRSKADDAADDDAEEDDTEDDDEDGVVVGGSLTSPSTRATTAVTESTLALLPVPCSSLSIARVTGVQRKVGGCIKGDELLFPNCRQRASTVAVTSNRRIMLFIVTRFGGAGTRAADVDDDDDDVEVEVEVDGVDHVSPVCCS